MKDFPHALHHDPIAQIGPDLFCTRGTIPINPLVTISRNMTIIRRGNALTLVNSVRLAPDELAKLEALGRVAHVLRLGGAHGRDDAFYVDRYGARFWAQPGGTRYTTPQIDAPLTDLGELPFDGAQLLIFAHARIPEAALLLRGGAGVLVTCDALQHYGDFSNNNLPARIAMPFLGFKRTTLIGPLWLKAATPHGGSLKTDFERLLDHDFDALFAAHGTFLPTGAKAAVRAAIATTFG
ncbi:hypothetical protein HL666_08430 [Bradyrhizobium sp. 83002]|uniref:hypothetical protein n=1 Tax=Bradyrhizobium aeschynomenes TaxID=2734909 RepID=UPI0015554F47|nr:hypothetical protein [Bradyrhizobium aeschynomenes]NPU10784.1 hypothetical protein [Bradyrhizobium aeschynomenes]